MKRYNSEDDLMRAVYKRMGSGVIVQEDRLNSWPLQLPVLNGSSPIQTIDEFEAGLRSLTARDAHFARFVPNIVHLRWAGQHLYTILANQAYNPDKMAATEVGSRTPERDRIMAVPGFAGFESHLFIDLQKNDARLESLPRPLCDCSQQSTLLAIRGLDAKLDGAAYTTGSRHTGTAFLR